MADLKDDPNARMVTAPDISKEEFDKYAAITSEVYELFTKHKLSTMSALNFIAFMTAYTLNDRAEGNFKMAAHNLTGTMAMTLQWILEFQRQDHEAKNRTVN